MSFQALTSQATNYIPRIAYCNVRIHHYIETRSKHTKEPVITTPSPTLDRIEQLYQEVQDMWEASDTCKRLRLTFESIERPDIDNIVAFACGSMAYGIEESHTIRAAFQHALVMTLQDILRKKLGHRRSTCHAQDPAYTQVDKAILHRRGIIVVNDPKAFLKIDESSLVVSFAPSIPVKQVVSDLTRPAMMIWDRVSDHNAQL
jgi:hypothetical protein